MEPERRPETRSCRGTNKSPNNASRRVHRNRFKFKVSSYCRPQPETTSQNRSFKDARVETATHHQSTVPQNDLRSTTTHSSFPFQVFRKYSHSLGPDELEYLEGILKEHDIADEDVEMSVELIAKEYNKQDGTLPGITSCRSTLTPFQDAAMKVSIEILNRVYHSLQTSGDQRGRKEDAYLDPEDHLHFVNAFEMPLWHWSPERGSFEK